MNKSLIISSAALLFSCAWTNVTSIKDPNYSQIQFNSILVVAAFSDIEYRQDTELAFTKQLEKQGANVIRSIDMFPPTREVSNTELIDTLVENNIEAVLIIAFSDYWTSETYIPPYSTTSGSASIIGNSIYYSQNTQTYGGYYFSKPRINFELRLYDTHTGNTAWIAKTHTKGNAFADFNTLINSLASKSVKTLLEENLISDYSYRPRTQPTKTSIKSKNNPQLISSQETRPEVTSPATRLPNLRKSLPQLDKYTDQQIMEAYRSKHPELKNASDNEIIRILEGKSKK
ncbi:MAG: hypothetical protein ACE5HI_16885 [bacterium]